MYLKGEDLGSAAAHSSPEKSHGQRKSEVGRRRIFSRKNKDVSAKVKKMSEEVLKTRKPKRTENQRETQ